MKALIQRVTQATVSVDDRVIGSIGKGFLIFLGVQSDDTEDTAKKLAEKVLKYRICADADGKMNVNITQSQGDILTVSQFTLVADTSKGNRPGFSKGAAPDKGNHLYKCFIEQLSLLYRPCQTGEFGADMQVALVNDGPVTFMLECQ